MFDYCDKRVDIADQQASSSYVRQKSDTISAEE